jgi:hypothetical protein
VKLLKNFHRNFNFFLIALSLSLAFEAFLKDFHLRAASFTKNFPPAEKNSAFYHVPLHMFAEGKFIQFFNDILWSQIIPKIKAVLRDFPEKN